MTKKEKKGIGLKMGSPKMDWKETHLKIVAKQGIDKYYQLLPLDWQVKPLSEEPNLKLPDYKGWRVAKQCAILEVDAIIKALNDLEYPLSVGMTMFPIVQDKIIELQQLIKITKEL